MPARLGSALALATLLQLALATLPPPAHAQSAPSLPAGAAETEARLLTKVGPQTRGWIRQEAAREVATGSASQETATSAAAGYLNANGLGTGDVTAVAFLVLMESTKSSQEDLKAIADRVKAINQAKAALRQRLSSAPATPTTNTARSKTHSASATTAPKSSIAAPQIAITPRPPSKADFDRQLDAARNDLDAMNEMSEMESLRLQMAMDRMSKMMSTLSNLLKKLSGTSAAITQNLK